MKSEQRVHADMPQSFSKVTTTTPMRIQKRAFTRRGQDEAGRFTVLCLSCLWPFDSFPPRPRRSWLDRNLSSLPVNRNGTW